MNNNVSSFAEHNLETTETGELFHSLGGVTSKPPIIASTVTAAAEEAPQQQQLQSQPQPQELKPLMSIHHNSNTAVSRPAVERRLLRQAA